MNAVLRAAAVSAIVSVATLAGVSAEARTPAMPISTASFVRKAAEGGLAEVSLAQVATTRAHDDNVRAFAQRMVTDHGRANEQLKQLADTHHWKLPEMPDAAHREACDQLGTLSGAAFDRAFMKHMVSDHDQAVGLFEQYARSGRDRELRTWVVSTLPTLRDHRQMARTTWEALTASAAR